MSDKTTDIRSMSYGELETYVTEELKQPKFRAKQIFTWLHKRHVASFEEMTDLSKGLRSLLEEQTSLVTLKVEECFVSKLDGTRKYLFLLPDGNIIESVWMKYHHGNSVCVSTQVGCRMGCRFCASTIDGLVRNLTPSEILEQVYRIEADTKERVSHIVLMGSGEPFDNYDNVSGFLSLVSHPEGLGISRRNITISTCGIVEGIQRLAKDYPQITLALSLHAPNDEVRRQLMPIANKYHLTDVMQACREYSRETGRRVTFEYSLVKGVNDNEKEAKRLSDLLRGFPCHVNLIPVNPVRERTFLQPDAVSVTAFKKLLEKNGINVTIRREMGRDIQGACGQLRRSYLSKESH